MAARAYLDTHIALWLHDALIEKLSQKQIQLVESRSLYISEFVKLELQYLYEIKRIKLKPAAIINRLKTNADVRISSSSLNILIDQAMKISWTRDPFDRLITANTQIEKVPLLTQDARILKHCKLAVG